MRHGARGHTPRGYYAQSKYANVLFGLELDRRLWTLSEEFTGVRA